MGTVRPTLDEFRKQHESEQEGRSRFHKSICPVCGALVTNQAMGRKAHLRMHKRAVAQQMPNRIAKPFVFGGQ